jgi:hypothetical protein
MDEFRFVIKCFIFAAALVAFSQVKIENQTLENKAELFLHNSATVDFVQKVADGGVKILNQAVTIGRAYINNKKAERSQSDQPLFESED